VLARAFNKTNVVNPPSTSEGALVKPFSGLGIILTLQTKTYLILSQEYGSQLRLVEDRKPCIAVKLVF